ncbi:NAD(P)-binding protein [Xylariaceae sp. FL1651]|nr:NAD(P)-binding protein [Xylariaceae sp. FL1651]
MSSILYSPALDFAAYLREVVFSPLLSGLLLSTVTYAPDALRDGLLKLVSRLSGQHAPPSSRDLSTINTVLHVLFALGVVRHLNRILNTMAANSWRLAASGGWDWPNEVAVVTGGSSGIGKEIVKRLAALGVRTAILDIQDPPKSMEHIPCVRFFKCDVTSSESITAAAEAVRRELGHPSILINNAGIARPTPILKMPETFLRRIFGVNCISHWLTVQQFLPHMIQMNKGHVVTIASIASFVALPTAADYSASKAATLAFHESLTCELKHYYKAPHVLTTVVHPNFVCTPLVRDFADQLERSGVRMLTSEQVAEPIVAQVKSQRGGQLILPRSASPISGIRGWPTWLQELIRDILGRSSVET